MPYHYELKNPLISLKVTQWSTFDQLLLLASEAPSSSISKNQKKSFKPGHFYAKISIKIDTPKCLKITVVMLVHLWGILFSSSWGMSFAIKCKFDRDSALKRGKIAHSQGLVNVICVRLKAVRY